MSAQLRRRMRTLLVGLGKKLGLIVGAILLASCFLAVSGYDFFAIFRGIWLGITRDFSGTIRWMTPLLFTALAVCLSQKALLFNLGADGQLYMGACAATYVALYCMNLPPAAAIATALLAGMAAGMLFAGIPALLKVLFGADEIVTTLLLNFVALQFTEFLVLGPMKTKGMASTTSTDTILEARWLPRILAPSQANVGLYIAIAVAVILALVMYKSNFGLEVKIVGSNGRLARYSGMSVMKVTLITMMISGSVAGLAGSVEVMGSLHRLPTGFNQNMGFEGIVVALLAQNNPVACIPAAFFFAALKNGAANMERISDVPSSVSEIVQAIMILVITVDVALPALKKWWARREQGKGGVQHAD